MGTDWSATGTMLQGIGSVATPIAVAVAAWVGANTFRQWRRQKIAERHLEQAELILTAAYKARRALAQVRAPMTWAYELSAAEETLKADPKWATIAEDRQQRLITTQSYMNRLARTKDQQLDLDRLQPIARALFGPDLEKAMEDLNHQFWVVQVDAEAYADDNGNDQEFTVGLRRNMWSTGSKKYPDPIGAKVDEAIASIEETCLPILRLSSPSKPTK